ncbi:MAG: D-alanyl-D-alanine carboxypeptidase family protein [Rubrimonas sp.]|uniref:D-alanyl-D-alanine carboxypeptidase family protein n=1 Tax=Rubrimonas sp. TaxID=2036015 RepID=UPI002FDE0DB7
MTQVRMLVGACVALALAWALSPGPAEAAPGRAEIVMDMRTGEVLHARNADAKLHPASLTKMMTLYLVFEAVERGKLDLDQMVRVSQAAARQPAVKVGFKAGQRVRLRDLIRAAAVRSANDSAVVLAESVSGSEAAFAKLMTQRARQLGMTNTSFRNASGLTAAGQLSSARDMTILARRLYYDFPQYYNLFGREKTAAFGQTIRNTNRLLATYRGADGFKTGYTRAAGFNLVASAERGPVRVVATVFGGRSGAERNQRVAELLDLGFTRAPRNVREVPPVLTAALTAPVPAPRPGSGSGGVAAAQGSPSLFVEGARQVAQALAPAAAHAAEPKAPASVAKTVSPTARAPRAAPAPRLRGGTAIAVASADAGSGDWAVQLGAYAEREIAVARLAAAAFGALPQLAGAGREVHVGGIAGSQIYRARLTGLDRDTARRACEMLVEEGRDCVPIPPAHP